MSPDAYLRSLFIKQWFSHTYSLSILVVVYDMILFTKESLISEYSSMFTLIK